MNPNNDWNTNAVIPVFLLDGARDDDRYTMDTVQTVIYISVHVYHALIHCVYYSDQLWAILLWSL